MSKVYRDEIGAVERLRLVVKVLERLVYYFILYILYHSYFYFKGIRDGLIQASMRYAKVNNKKVPGYEKSKTKSWLVYQDCKYILFIFYHFF